MFTRRQAMYAGSAGLAVLAIGRLARPHAVKAATTYEVTHSDAEWRKLCEMPRVAGPTFRLMHWGTK